MAARTFFEIQAPCYRFQPKVALTEEQCNKLRALAGPRLYQRGRWAGTIECPDNVAWLVEEYLNRWDVPFAIVQYPTWRKERTWEQIREDALRRGEVKPETLEGLFEYQQEGITFACNRGSAALWHPGGSGKTRVASIAMFDIVPAPQPVVVVTKAGPRGQWQYALQNFTNLTDIYVIQPMEDYGDVPQSARELLAVRGLGAKTITKLFVDAGIRTIEQLKGAVNDGSLLKLKGFGKKRVEKVRHALRRLRPIPETLDDYMHRMRSTRQRPVVIVAWTSLRDWWEPLTRVLAGVGGVIFDEIHMSKQSKRQRVKVSPDGDVNYTDLGNLSSSAEKVARAARYRIGATATAVKDRLRDLWGQLDLIEPGAWGTSSTWLRRYCAATEGEYGGLITTGFAEEHLDELNYRMSYLVHHVDYAVSHAALKDLKRRESWRIGVEDLGDGWDHAKIRSELKAARGSSTATLEVQVAAAAAQVRAPLLVRIADDIEATPNAKICVLDIRHENVDTMAKELREHLDGVEVIAVHGGNTTPATRETIRRYYMEHPGPLVLCATGESIGTGFDLHDTDLAYLAALPWNPGELHQWEARFSRHGQKRPVRIVFCLPVGSVIEVIANRILAKMPAVEKVGKDHETARAFDALAGTDNPEKLAEEIMDLLGNIDADFLSDDD